MKLRDCFLCVLMVSAGSLGCSKSEGTSSSSAPAAQNQAGSAASVKDIEAKLQKAGWKFTSNEENDDLWPARLINAEKGEDDAYRSATVWIDEVGSSIQGKPKPHVVVGQGALLRFGWDPRDAAKPGVDLAGFAKDIVAITPPEKATDELFRSEKFDATVKKWGLSGPDSGGGSRATNADVIFNHRTPNNDAGTLLLDIVHYQKALAEGRAQLFGTTLVTVLTKDDASKKEIIEALRH